MKNLLLTATLLMVFATANVFTQDKPQEPPLDESKFAYPKDASVGQLLDIVENRIMKTLDAMGNRSNPKSSAEIRRELKMDLDTVITIFEKNPGSEQVERTMRLVNLALLAWRSISLKDSKSQEECFAYLRKFDAIFEQQLNKELPLPLKERILAFQARYNIWLGDAGRVNKAENWKESYTKALAKADAYLAIAKDRKDDSSVLDARADAFLKLHWDDKTPEFLGEYEKRMMELEKFHEKSNPGFPRLMLAKEKINWYAENDGKIADVQSSLDYIKKFVTEVGDNQRYQIFALSKPLTQIGENSGKSDFYDSVVADFQAAYRASQNPALVEFADFIDAQKRVALGSDLKLFGKNLDGSDFDWASLRGKYVVVKFTATWCGPCKKEIPGLISAYEKYHDKGLEIVSVYVWERGNDNDKLNDRIKEVSKEEKINWRIISEPLTLKAGGQKIGEFYGVQGVPTMLLIDKEGKVIDTAARGQHLQDRLAEIFDSNKQAANK